MLHLGDVDVHSTVTTLVAFFSYVRGAANRFLNVSEKTNQIQKMKKPFYDFFAI